MIKYYIINNASRASKYGVGTYITQLLSCLSSIKDVNVFIIDMFADTDEYSVSVDNANYIHYLIPRIEGIVESDIYCRSAFYYIVQQVNSKSDDDIIFHFNYYQHFQLAMRLKTFNPTCKIFFTVHYLSWCFILNGNLSKFRIFIDKQRNLFRNKMEFNSDYAENEDKLLINKGDELMESYQLECKFMQLADSVIVLSKKTNEIIEKDYHIDGNKLIIIKNGLEDRFCKLKENNFFKKRNRKNSWDSRINVLYVGRLDEIKGVCYLIKAFKILYEKDKSLHLYLIGDGDMGYYLSEAQEICEAVTFTYRLNYLKTEHFYSQATIGVLPSFHEQCSYTAIEMMMNAIPYIGTDSTGLKEMLENTPGNIVHIDEDNFDANSFIRDLSQKMSKLIYNKNYYKESSYLVRQSYLDSYTINQMEEGYKNLINKSIKIHATS